MTSSKKSVSKMKIRLVTFSIHDVLIYLGLGLLLLNMWLSSDPIEDIPGVANDLAPASSRILEDTKLGEFLDALELPPDFKSTHDDDENTRPPPPAPRLRTLELEDAPFPDPDLPIGNSMAPRLGSVDSPEIDWQGNGEHVNIVLGIYHGAPPEQGLGFTGATPHDTLSLTYDDGQGGRIIEQGLLTHIHPEGELENPNPDEWFVLPPLEGFALRDDEAPEVSAAPSIEGLNLHAFATEPYGNIGQVFDLPPLEGPSLRSVTAQIHDNSSEPFNWPSPM